MEELVFKPEDLNGISFLDNTTGARLRYIYPDTKHWTAGWLIVQNKSGVWMTLRKATDSDIETINKAVVTQHHLPQLDESSEI